MTATNGSRVSLGAGARGHPLLRPGAKGVGCCRWAAKACGEAAKVGAALRSSLVKMAGPAGPWRLERPFIGRTRARHKTLDAIDIPG